MKFDIGCKFDEKVWIIDGVDAFEVEVESGDEICGGELEEISLSGGCFRGWNAKKWLDGIATGLITNFGEWISLRFEFSKKYFGDWSEDVEEVEWIGDVEEVVVVAIKYWDELNWELFSKDEIPGKNGIVELLFWFTAGNFFSEDCMPF